MIDFFLELELKDVVFTFLSTAIGIYFTIKYTQKRELIFIENKCNWLGKMDSSSNSKEFEYQLTIKNSGNVDIDKTIIHKPINIIIPKDYLIKSATIIKKSGEIEVNIINDKNSVEFNWNLLKKQEFFQIKLIVSYIESKENINSGFDIIHNFLKKKNINSRITDSRFKEILIPNNFTSDEVFSIYIGGHHELFFFLLLFTIFGGFGYLLITDYSFFYLGFILIIISLFLSYTYIKLYSLYMKKSNFLFEIEDIENE